MSHIGLDGIRTLAGNAVDTVTNVVMPGKDAGNNIPLTGTIVIVAGYTASLLGAAGTASTQVTRRVVVTFNGTVTPTPQMKIRGVFHTFASFSARDWFAPTCRENDSDARAFARCGIVRLKSGASSFAARRPTLPRGTL